VCAVAREAVVFEQVARLQEEPHPSGLEDMPVDTRILSRLLDTKTIVASGSGAPTALAGRIVVLGGAYSSHDEVHTGRGTVYGAYLHGTAIGQRLCEMTGSCTRGIHHFAAWAIDVVVGVVFGVLMLRLWHRVREARGCADDRERLARLVTPRVVGTVRVWAW